MLNVERTIISQYATSSAIVQLIQGMDAHIDPRADIDAFYKFVWNVDTALDFGLDIWGRIVGVDRYLQIPPDGDYLGFGEAGNPAQPFGQAPFYVATGATQTYRLEADAYRKLILVKALSNISATTAPAINQLLQNLFAGRGRCYVNDSGNMTLRYTFEFLLTNLEFAIMTQSGALPRPAGVYASLINAALPVFGFSEAGSDSASPFGYGTFISESATHAAN